MLGFSEGRREAAAAAAATAATPFAVDLGEGPPPPFPALGGEDAKAEDDGRGGGFKDVRDTAREEVAFGWGDRTEPRSAPFLETAEDEEADEAEAILLLPIDEAPTSPFPPPPPPPPPPLPTPVLLPDISSGAVHRSAPRSAD